jgi:hypothetical protein
VDQPPVETDRMAEQQCRAQQNNHHFE